MNQDQAWMAWMRMKNLILNLMRWIEYVGDGSTEAVRLMKMTNSSELIDKQETEGALTTQRQGVVLGADGYRKGDENNWTLLIPIHHSPACAC